MLFATARRVLAQLRHDRRTIVLMVAAPTLLMVLLRYVFASAQFFDRIAPALLGFFPFLMMFLVSSITTLRERSSGTLERLLTTPMAKIDLLAGYTLAFGLIAIVQVLVVVAVSLRLGLSLNGSLGWLVLVALLDALLGVALGLLASAFARTEFQAVQFMPIIVLPQLLLCGLFHPRAQMAPVLHWLSDVMPLSYAVEALQIVASSPTADGRYLRDVVIVVGCTILGLVVAAATLRRQSA